MAKAKLNVDHFCIDDILDEYVERDSKRIKKLEKKKKEEVSKFEVEITLN